MSLGSYITLEEASQRYNLDARLLTRFVRNGRIRGGRFDGTFVLLEKDTKRMAEQIENTQAVRQQLRAKVAHLEGQTIGMREAAEKYGLDSGSISRWAKAGYIRIRERGGKGLPTLVDESDVAYTKEIVKLRNVGQGKRVFTAEFIPDWF